MMLMMMMTSMIMMMVVMVLILVIKTDIYDNDKTCEFTYDISIPRSEEELHNVKITHKPPEGIVDKVTHFSL